MLPSLPYEDSSISGYLSFGVIEHFIEGPHEALAEAFRVLRPGGIAIITTPGVFFSHISTVILKILQRRLLKR